MNSPETPPNPFPGGGDGSSSRLPVKLNLLAAPAGVPHEAVVESWIQEWLAKHIPEAEDERAASMQVGESQLVVRTVTLPSGGLRHVFFQVGEFPEASGPAPSRQDVLPGGVASGFRRAWVVVPGAVLVVAAAAAWVSRACNANGDFPWFLPVFAGFFLFLAWFKLRDFLKGMQLAGVSLVALGMGVLVWIAVWKGFPGSRVYLENNSGRQVELCLNGGGWVSLRHGRSMLVTWPRRAGEVFVRDQGTKAELDRHPVSATTPGPYILNILGAQTYYSGAITYSANPLLPSSGDDSWESAVADRWFAARVDFLFEIPPHSIKVKARNDSLQSNQQRTYLLRHSIRPNAAEVEKMSEFLKRMTEQRAAARPDAR